MNWQKNFSIRAGLFAMTLATAACAWADVKPNPYESIVDRNPFGLRPPPDPSTTQPPPPPAAPPATVELTGITSLFQKDRALLEITPGPGKPVIRPILSPGERVESVEVVSINVEKNEVVIKNGSIVTNLSLKVAKAGAPPPAAPGQPVPPAGINPGGFRPPPALPQPTAFTPNNAMQNDAGRGGAVTYGAGATPGVSTFGASATPGYGGAAPAAYGAAPALGKPATAVGATDGLRGIPQRTVRAQATPEGQPVDPAVQYINMRVQELESKKAGRPFPPLPPIPGLNDQ